MIDVRKIRHQMQLTQAEFARRYGFNIATLRDWEYGRRSPGGPSRVLLTVVAHSPDVVDQALDVTRAVG